VTLAVNGTTQIVPTFKPETVWTYEAGAKGTFLDGRVSLSAAAFYSDYKDFQARVGGGNTGINGGSFPSSTRASCASRASSSKRRCVRPRR
jgi:iron complex outermembrane receptor protein